MGNEPRLGSKVFYKIGEVSKIAKLPAYVLRFWESEFSFLKPKKSRGNQRLYVLSRHLAVHRAADCHGFFWA